MRVSHHVKRSVCLLLSLLLLAQGMTLGAAAVGTDSVPAGTSVLEPAAYPDSEVLVLYEDGRTEVVVYEDAASLEEGLPQLARQEGVALVQPNYTYTSTALSTTDPLLAAYPAYRAFVIPAGTYAGQGEDVWTVSVQALLLASNALSDETVQRLTARYFDSVDAVAAAVPVPLVTDPAVAAAQSVIPYHTGAAAYYTAQGITPAGPETGASPEQEAAA